MKRNYILAAALVLFIILSWVELSIVYASKPDDVIDLEGDQKKANEKLISTRIIDRGLDKVHKLFDKNLASSKNDSRNQEASMEFLDELTDILNKHDIKIIKIKPKTKVKTGKYTYIPYDLEIRCSYDLFGILVSELEKNARMINIDGFRLFNKMEKVSSKRNLQSILENKIEMKISTITLNK